MSISSFQEKFLNKGCGTALVIFFAVVFLAFGNSMCNNSSRNGGQPGEQGKTTLLATVGNTPISYESVENAVTQQTTQRLQMLSQGGAMVTSLPIMDQAQLQVQSVAGAVHAAALTEIADKSGIQVNEESIKKIISQQLAELKASLIKQGTLKATATQKEFDDVVKGYTGGKTGDEAIKEAVTAFGDPKTTGQIKMSFARAMLMDQLKAKNPVTDAEVKASFDSAILKLITIQGNKPGTKESVDARADKVQAELKAGKSFESLMDTLSDEPNFDKKKKRSEQNRSVPVSMFDSIPDYATLKGQKAGFISGPVKVGADITFFKIDSFKSDIPKDFDKQKEQLRQQAVQTKVQKEVEKMISSYLATAKIDWQIKGYEVLYGSVDAMAPEHMKEREALLHKVYENAKALVNKGDVMDLRPATFAVLLSEQTLYSLPSADKTKMVDERIEALNLVFKSLDDYDLRVELADLYAQKKDGTNAINALVAAAKANSSYDVTGQRRFYDLTQKGATYLKDKVITEEQLKSLDAIQTKWRNDKLEADKNAADAKAQEEKLRKQNEAELQRQKDEAAKKAPPAATPGVKPGEKPTTPGKPGAKPDTTGKFTGGN